MKLKRTILIGLTLLISATAILDVLHTPSAEAMTTYGRGIRCGYFTGQCNDPCIVGTGGVWCDDVIPGGVPGWVQNVDSLINWLRDLNNSPNLQYRSAGAFIVNTMLNYNGPGVGRPVSEAQLTELSKRLKNPAIGINWDNDNFSYRYNSAWAVNQRDNIFYDEGRTKSTNDVIGVYYNGRLVYALRRECANPLGDNNWPTGVPEYNPPWNLTGYSYVRNSSVNPGGDFYSTVDAYPGEAVTWRTDLRNLSGGTSTYFEHGPRRQTNGGPVTAPRPNTGGVYGPGAWSGFMYDDATIPVMTGQVCQWIEFAPSSSTNAGAGRSQPFACVNVQPVTGTCSTSVTLTPSQIQPGVPFTISDTSIIYGNDRAANSARNNGSNYYVRVFRLNPVTGAPEAQVFSQNLIPTTVANGRLYGQPVTVPGSQIQLAGQYRVYWGNSGSVGVTNCGDQNTNFQAAYYPYFNVVGGDISAGRGFQEGTTCPTVASAGISSWNGGNYGAGSTLAALALGTIRDFATATNSSNGSTTAPTSSAMANSLTFANAAGISGQLGTNALPCMPNYYETAVSNTSATQPINVMDLGVTLPASGTYRYSGNVTITNLLNAQIPNGRQITIVTDGDVYLEGNIRYAPYSEVRNVPRFTVIAKGDIYVSSLVSELHGVFIAQPLSDNTKGVFSTCSLPLGVSVPSNIVYSTCNRQLNIYGAVAAKNIRLQRTYGSLAASAGAPAAPAESFIYSPELWLSNGVTNATGQSQPFDAITTLPPTF